MKISWLIAVLAVLAFFHFQKNKKPETVSYSSQSKNKIICQAEDPPFKNQKTAFKNTKNQNFIFINLDSQRPQILQPYKAFLKKIKEQNGIYWLLLNKGNSQFYTFTIDTHKKVMVRRKSLNEYGLSIHGSALIRKCI